MVTSTGKNTTYTYDAAGQKLRRVTGTQATDYAGGIQYEGAGSPSVSFIRTEEGRALPNGATAYNYEYTLTDHLGNSRVNFDTGTGTARQVQKDDYYPFGLEIQIGSAMSPKNNYLYNSKELQDNLQLYDYGARFYDPVVGRWTSVDPSAENDASYLPYIYAFDNSIRFTDPDGRWPNGNCCGVVGAFAGGLYNNLKGAVIGTIDAVSHPIQTITGIANLAVNPVVQIQAGNAVINAASNGYQKFKNGDANTKAAILGAVVGEAGQLFGGELAEIGKVPGLCNLGRVGEIVDNVGEAVKVVNGNSKASTNAQHVYEIVNNTTGTAEKVGVSGGKISQTGNSYRATQQVNKLNKAGGNYSSRIAKQIPAGSGARRKALEVEKIVADKNRSTLNPDIHQRP